MEGISLDQELQDAIYSLGLFAVIVPLEMVLNQETRASLKNRLINLVYMVGYLFVGGFILQLLLPYLEIVSVRSKITNPFLYVVIYLVITDILFYLYHRLQHSIPFLWKIHRPHHSDPDMNITTSYRTNLFEFPLQYIFIGLPVVWLLGFNKWGMFYGFYIAQFFLLLGHAKLNFDYGIFSRLFVTPATHRIHHSNEKIHRNKNFTQYFPFIDMLGGTYHRPKKDEFPKTGL